MKGFCMQKRLFLGLASLILFSSHAYAFGGGHSEGQADFWGNGVDAIGAYFGGKEKAKVDFSAQCDAEHNKQYDIHGVCKCVYGYEQKGNECVKSACAGCNNGVCINQVCYEYNYCQRTDSNGTCVQYGYCPYESSGNKIVGVPDAEGGCALNENYRVVCLDTDAKGRCIHWGEPCEKGDEYHEIIGIPDARSFCCDPGYAYCTHYNEDNKCTYWDCAETACDLITNKNPCKNYTPQGSECVESNKPNTTKCDNPEDVEGNANFICQTGTCTDPCTIGEHANFTPTTCFPAHHAENGQCVPDYEPKGTHPKCDDEHSQYVCNGQGGCICPEGQFRQVNGGGGRCQDCSSKSSSYSVPENVCAECDGTANPRKMWVYEGISYCVLASCPNGTFRNNRGECLECSQKSSAISTAEDCAACDDTDSPRIMIEGRYCSIPTCSAGEFRRKNGTCLACDWSSPELSDSSDDCAACDNTDSPRTMWEYDGKSYCVLASCPERKFRRTNGECQYCSDALSHPSTVDDCAVCDSTDTPRIMWEHDDKSYCAPTTCQLGKFRTNSGSCYDCSTTKVQTSAEECAACDNTDSPRRMFSDGYCVVVTCPPGQYHADSKGTCQNCSITSSYRTTAEYCATCDSTNTPRAMFEDYCGLITCPTGTFHDNTGYCEHCSVNRPLTAKVEYCNECDNTENPRFMGADDRCYICTFSSSVTTTQEACQKCGATRTWTETTPATENSPAVGTCALASS